MILKITIGIEKILEFGGESLPNWLRDGNRTGLRALFFQMSGQVNYIGYYLPGIVQECYQSTMHANTRGDFFINGISVMCVDEGHHALHFNCESHGPVLVLFKRERQKAAISGP